MHSASIGIRSCNCHRLTSHAEWPPCLLGLRDQDPPASLFSCLYCVDVATLYLPCHAIPVVDDYCLHTAHS
eukprot:3312826-Amphidinium_carterae.1